jgi:hypothetical protein
VCEGEEGKVEGRYEEKRRPLHAFETVHFLNLSQNLLPLTNGHKKVYGRTKDASYFLGISFYSCH